eukprot:scaffold3821_cov127-Cylindrotheca_fusiformis.AAC.11
MATLFIVCCSYTSCHAWSICLNAHGQPRLTSLVSGTVHCVSFLCLGTFNDKQVVVRSESNRKVLQGRFQEISLSGRDVKNPSLISLDKFHVQGNNLHFGYTPLLLATGVPTFFYFVSLRSLIWMALLGTLWGRIGGWQQFRTALESSTAANRILHHLSKVVNAFKGSPCEFDYCYTLTDSNMAQSPAVQRLAQSLVQTFMANSILPFAAAVGDTTNQILLASEEAARLQKHQQQQQQQSQQQSPSTNSNNSNSSIVPLQQRRIMAAWNEREGSSFQFSKLLSATSFDLQNDGPVSCSDGHIWLPCIAKLPSSEGQLEFTLRTKMTAGTIGDGSNGAGSLEFSVPECRVDVDAAMGSSSSNWSRALLPKHVWLPIGANRISLPLAFSNVHHLTKIQTIMGSSEICGRLQFFHPAKQQEVTTTSGLDRIRNTLSSFRPRIPDGRDGKQAPGRQEGKS